jgi:molecular chaperone GrpE
MSDPKGPKVDLPEGLAEELEGVEEPNAEGAPAAPEPAGEIAPADSGAHEAPAADTGATGSVEAQLEETREKYLRLAADYENFRRRALKERQDLHNYAVENFVKELLPTVDNLERALAHARQGESTEESKAAWEGVELTYRSLLQCLERFGVVPVAAEGEAFDPQVHEAVQQLPTAEHPPGRVVGVLQKGYLLKDRLLRPALVAVSMRAEGGSE